MKEKSYGNYKYDKYASTFSGFAIFPSFDNRGHNQILDETFFYSHN